MFPGYFPHLVFWHCLILNRAKLAICFLLQSTHFDSLVFSLKYFQFPIQKIQNPAVKHIFKEEVQQQGLNKLQIRCETAISPH